MSLPKGQRWEYKVSWQWHRGGYVREEFFDDGDDAAEFAKLITDSRARGRKPNSLHGLTFVERRPVGEWEKL